MSNTTYRVSFQSDPRQFATSLNIARRKTDPLDLSSDQLTLTVDRQMSLTSGAYQIAGVQVVGARQTGWVADTGTAKLTANATYTAGTTLTYSASYTQSELTATGTRIAAIETALQNATQELKAIKDALMTTGIIGT